MRSEKVDWLTVSSPSASCAARFAVRSQEGSSYPERVRHQATNSSVLSTMVYSLVALSAASACLADAPPPLLRHIPVEAEGIEPELACGDFKWRVEGPTLFGGGHECWEGENGPSCFIQFKRANLNCVWVGDNHYDVLEAIYRLSNEEELYWTQGSPALTPISASAEKVGWLFYTPPADGYIALT